MDTINFWQRFNPIDLFGDFTFDDKMFPAINRIAPLLPNVMVNAATLQGFLSIATAHCTVIIAANLSLLARPTPIAPIAPAAITFLSPLFDLVTSKYNDMHVMLNHISTNYIGMLYL